MDPEPRGEEKIICSRMDFIRVMYCRPEVAVKIVDDLVDW